MEGKVDLDVNRVIVLPNKDIGDWEHFWQEQNNEISRRINEGVVPPKTRTWYCYGDTAERAFYDMRIPDDPTNYNGYVYVTKGGYKIPGSEILSSQIYFTTIQTDNPISEQVKEALAHCCPKGILGIEVTITSVSVVLLLKFFF